MSPAALLNLGRKGHREELEGTRWTDDEFIPVYAVTGFLDAGKTTLLNHIFRSRLSTGMALCCIQFEEGDRELERPDGKGSLDVLTFSIDELNKDAGAVAVGIYTYLVEHDPDEVWVEWNGMAPLSALQALFPHRARACSGTPGEFCRVRKILHLADAASLEGLLSSVASLADQIAGSDLVLLRNFAAPGLYARMRRLVRGMNPGVKVLGVQCLPQIDRELRRPERSPGVLFLLGTLYLGVAYLGARLVLGSGGTLDAVVNIFLGIMLQAVPFLLIGVLLSSAIQMFVSQKLIEERFPRNPAAGMVFAVLAGLCLPVCDCTSIPVFRSLVRKGVPLPAAVTFLAVTPIINPVVVLSTWYAFSGSWKIVACRAGLGIVCAVAVGLTFSRSGIKNTGVLGGAAGGTYCSCGCSTDPDAGRFSVYLQHAQGEFFSVGKYLVLGAFISALFQTHLAGLFRSGNSLLPSLLVMMAMAFCFSLCSSSDAVVARSFAAQFPLGALLGFLVFGPMMDIKNVIMLTGSFSGRFVARLALTMFLVCAGVVFTAFSFGLGGLLQ